MKVNNAMLSAAVGLAAASSLVSAAPQFIGTDGRKKNIVLFLTDDQSTNTLDRDFLPRIYKHLVDEGVIIDSFTTPVSVCCPSRVSLVRSQFAHNHNVTFVSQPWGGWARFNELGYLGHHLPDFLQKAGYKTGLIGKWQNDHTVENCESLPLSGWDYSAALVDPHTYDYWTPALSYNNGPAVVYENTYSTDLIKETALKFLDTVLPGDDPFFAYIAPVACHSWLTSVPADVPVGKIESDIPAAHPRHARLFTKVQLPRHEGFNPKEPSGVSWVKDLPRLNATTEAYMDEFYRGRLRALQPVDEMVEEVIEKVRAAGKLDDTYFFYTADNGYALGTHRRQPGKTLGFEEDLRVPFIARGPGITPGVHDTLSSYGMADLGATILAIAGAETDYVNDGNVIAPVLAPLSHHTQRHTISEYWTLAVTEGAYGGEIYTNNTYRTVRVHDETPEGNYSYSYSVWCTGERELYDLDEDPHQVRNLLVGLNAQGAFAPFNAKKHGKFVVSKKLQKILTRLDTLTLQLKNCVGDGCRDPWSRIFSNAAATGGQLSSLPQALHDRFDAYFESVPRVHFTQCALGYQTRFEKPVWDDTMAYGYGVPNPLNFQGR